MITAKAPDRAINWKVWTGLLISALFLYAAFRQVDPVRTWEVIRKADISLLLLTALVTLFQHVIRAWRWRIFLDPVQETGFSSRLSSLIIGFAANCILPARLGEFVRANYMGRTSGVSRSSAFGTIVIERLFDGFTLLLFLLIGLLATTFPTELQSLSGSIRVTGLMLFLSCVFLVLLLAGFKYKAELFLKLLERLFFFLPSGFLLKIMMLIRNFTAGLVLLRGYREWTGAVFYSLLLWVTSLLQIMLIALSIGLDLPVMSTFLIMAMAFLGVMIPSAPGFIGTFHLSVQYGFMFYGTGREEALSAAILWHAASYFPTVISGLIFFLYVQSSFEKCSGEHP